MIYTLVMLSLFDTAKRILKSFFAERHLLGDDNLFSINDILSKTKIIKKGVFRAAPTLQKYKIEDLKPDFKKELESRINV